MNALTDLNEGLRKFLITTRKIFFPISSNIGLGILLLIGEKLMEFEFTCPCGDDRRVHFLVLLFVIPGVVTFVLMTAIQGRGILFCGNCSRENLGNILLCIFPPAVWVMLLLFDGRYYTCLMSNWPGQYVNVSYNDLEKWCEPENKTSSKEKLNKSYGWYICSRIYGFYLLGALAILALIIITVKSQLSNSGGTSSTPEGNVNIDSQSLSTPEGNVNIDSQSLSTPEGNVTVDPESSSIADGNNSLTDISPVYFV